MGKANLTYYIFEGVLVGTVNGEAIHVIALSGGGGGSTSKAGASDAQAVNNPYRTGQRKREETGVRGGPIPVGKYAILKPEAWGGGRAARLESADPKFTANTNRTGGFLIHNSGPKGSDGCIVPKHSTQFHSLMDALEKDEGGTLAVLESQGGSRFG